MNASPRFESAAFATSVAELDALASAPLDPALPELAFVGRSNAGKSSAINALVGQKRLAFASKTPGRTQLLNFFCVSDDAPLRERRDCAYLVDLPGYGFAKTNDATRDRWDSLVGGYLLQRRQLRGVVLVMDSRRPLQKADHNLLAWIQHRANPEQVRLHLLLTKADQIGKRDQRAAMDLGLELAHAIEMPTSVQLFSALDRTGLDELREAAAQMIEGSDAGLDAEHDDGAGGDAGPAGD
jgi:GTP-binding protein